MPLLLFLLLARWPAGEALPRLDEFDTQMHRRFEDGRLLGMSRIARWPTRDRHFKAPLGAKNDFAPENEMERAIVAGWNEESWQVGLYVFGRAIRTSKIEDFQHRALKGPAVLLDGTPRASVPAWGEVFPVAAKAQSEIEGGAKEYRARLNGWNVVARPVLAGATCGMCHASSAPPQSFSKPDDRTVTFQEGAKAGEPIGGLLYLYRETP